MSNLCPCKVFVTGKQCDKCKERYYGLGLNSTTGCSPCDCSRDGTLNELDICDQLTGQCTCKQFAGSLNCGECAAGTYKLMVK